MALVLAAILLIFAPATALAADGDTVSSPLIKELNDRGLFPSCHKVKLSEFVGEKDSKFIAAQLMTEGQCLLEKNKPEAARDKFEASWNTFDDQLLSRYFELHLHYIYNNKIKTEEFEYLIDKVKNGWPKKDSDFDSHYHSQEISQVMTPFLLAMIPHFINNKNFKPDTVYGDNDSQDKRVVELISIVGGTTGCEDILNSVMNRVEDFENLLKESFNPISETGYKIYKLLQDSAITRICPQLDRLKEKAQKRIDGTQ